MSDLVRSPWMIAFGLVALAAWLIMRGQGATNHGPATGPLTLWSQQGSSRPELARLVRSGGYSALSDEQKAACTQLYLTDLCKLRKAVNDRLLVSLAAVPHFQLRPQYGQMNRAIQLLNMAIHDLEQNGPYTDCTQYQGLINEVIKALRRP